MSIVAHRPGPKLKLPTKPFPPFIVQAFKPGFNDPWFADSTHRTLVSATAAAMQLERTHGRKARVVDQEEQVWYRSPGIKARAQRRG